MTRCATAPPPPGCSNGSATPRPSSLPRATTRACSASTTTAMNRLAATALTCLLAALGVAALTGCGGSGATPPQAAESGEEGNGEEVTKKREEQSELAK